MQSSRKKCSRQEKDPKAGIRSIQKTESHGQSAVNKDRAEKWNQRLAKDRSWAACCNSGEKEAIGGLYIKQWSPLISTFKTSLRRLIVRCKLWLQFPPIPVSSPPCHVVRLLPHQEESISPSTWFWVGLRKLLWSREGNGSYLGSSKARSQVQHCTASTLSLLLPCVLIIFFTLFYNVLTSWGDLLTEERLPLSS